MLRQMGLAICLMLITNMVAAQSNESKITPLHLKSLTTDTLKIAVGREQCRDLQPVIVVMDGHDADRSFKIVQDKDDSCRWTATRRVGNEIGETFDTEFAQFSLRLGIARTNCKHAKPVSKEAILTFKVVMTGARHVIITNPSGIPISFVRGVPKSALEPDSIDCVETRPFATPTLEIVSAWFSPAALSPKPAIFAEWFDRMPRFENVWIQFNTIKADAETPGLIINDVTVTKYLKNGRGSLNREQILAALLAQRSQGRAGMPPHCPPAADDAYREKFKALSLKGVDMVLAVK